MSYKEPETNCTVSLESQIVKPPRDGKKDIQEIKQLIDGDYLAVYDTLAQEEKRVLWRGIIDSITMRRGEVVGVIFFVDSWC